MYHTCGFYVFAYYTIFRLKIAISASGTPPLPAITTVVSETQEISSQPCLP